MHMLKIYVREYVAQLTVKPCTLQRIIHYCYLLEHVGKLPRGDLTFILDIKCSENKFNYQSWLLAIRLKFK